MPSSLASLDRQFLGNRLDAWITAALIAGAVWLLLWVLKVVVGRRLAVLAARTETQLDDVASDLLGPGGPDPLLAQVPGLTFEVTRESAAAARVGVSQLDWAIAGTGTLVQDATAVAKRLVSTLPTIHVAVIGTGRILESLGGVLQRLRPDQVNCISFITGPSRTADIERVLTIGVHGPERLVIVAVDDLEEVAA